MPVIISQTLATGTAAAKNTYRRPQTARPARNIVLNRMRRKSRGMANMMSTSTIWPKVILKAGLDRSAAARKIGA